MKAEQLPKRILVDANFLFVWFGSKSAPADRLRIEQLLKDADSSKSKFVIPVPAIAEFLVGADIAGIETVNKLDRNSAVIVAPFDIPAAFECSQLDRAALGAGDKKDGIDEPWQKIKVDRQIVAIGKANGTGLAISNDKDVRNNALRVGMRAICLQDLELPPQSAQVPLPFENAPAPTEARP